MIGTRYVGCVGAIAGILNAIVNGILAATVNGSALDTLDNAHKMGIITNVLLFNDNVKGVAMWYALWYAMWYAPFTLRPVGDM